MKWKAVMFTCPTLPAGQTVKIKHLKPDLLEESLVTDGSEVNSPNLAIHSDIHEKTQTETKAAPSDLYCGLHSSEP